jgi:hypothetical protein
MKQIVVSSLVAARMDGHGAGVAGLSIAGPATPTSYVDGNGRAPEHDERIALHEIGGHALVARLLGNEIGGVTCDPGV